jgi:gamma-glutamyltranspeptidase/glutathione hydrolase
MFTPTSFRSRVMSAIIGGNLSLSSLALSSLALAGLALAGVSLASLSPPQALAETQPILSPEARFQPVFARNGMVVSQEERASTIGLDILKRGGNAVDAAVAVGFALAVTLPRAGNLGGGGFMMIHLAEKNETIALDYREIAPASATREMFLNEAGIADPELSRFTGLGVGVPGTVAGLIEAHGSYGSGELSLSDLIAPALALAEGGIPINQDLYISLGRAAPRLSRDDYTRGIFYPGRSADDVVAPDKGSILRQRDLAGTLRRIAQNGKAGFYDGPVARAIADTVVRIGGTMTVEDLAAYEVRTRTPIRGHYRGYEIVSMPPPSSGGLHIAQIMAMLERFDIPAMGPGSADSIHVLAESMRRAYADRATWLGDPDFSDVPVSALLGEDYLADRGSDIDMARSTPSSEVSAGQPQGAPEPPQTTHFSIVDSEGNAVSNTYTLNFSYGVGVAAEGTGVLLNNELDDFAAAPGVANAYGLVGGAANAPAPLKRPLSSMSPTLVFAPTDTGDQQANDQKRLWLVTGSPGGSRIISIVTQIIVNMIDHDMNIAEATAFPRMHHQWLPDRLFVERGFSPDSLTILRKRGHQVEVRRASGSTQSIVLRPDGWLAGATDPRRSGSAATGY